MNLLEQLGVKPLSTVKGSHAIHHDVIITALKVNQTRKTPYNSVNIRGLLTKYNLKWEGVDVGYSKAHGGLLIAKGTYFKLDDNGRFVSRSVVDAVRRGYGLKECDEARICLSTTKYSEDVFVCKLESFEELDLSGIN